MLSENHDLASELPQYKDAIHDLKTTDNHFARLFDEYEEINKAILRIEIEVEAASDQRLEDMKKTRLSLKDELVTLLKKAAA